jgi:hypothetical protein
MYMGAKTMWFQPLMGVRIGEAVGLLYSHQSSCPHASWCLHFYDTYEIMSHECITVF